VNLAILDHATAERLHEDFATDVRNSCELTLVKWRKRPVLERLTETLGSALQRQQQVLNAFIIICKSSDRYRPAIRHSEGIILAGQESF